MAAPRSQQGLRGRRFKTSDERIDRQELKKEQEKSTDPASRKNRTGACHQREASGGVTATHPAPTDVASDGTILAVLCYTAPLPSNTSLSLPESMCSCPCPCLTTRTFPCSKGGCQAVSGPCYVHPLFKDGMIPMMAIGRPSSR